MSQLRIAVLGGGHLGTIHARLLQQVSDAELSAIVELDQNRAAELREQFSCDVVTDVNDFIENGEVDAVIVAAPTTLHHKIGTRLLRRGVHCFIEKPLAPTARECEELVAVAQQSNCVLQVGHVERFNPVWTTMCNAVGEPRLIEATREAPLTFRSLDAGVVLDLMIHDIDLILSLVKSPVAKVQATGLAWTGAAEDLAQARVTFVNGCVANLTASRISTSPKRTMRVFGHDWYSELDFADRTCHVVDGPQHRNWQARAYSASERQALIDTLFEHVTPRNDLCVPEANPILDELRDLVTSIRTRSQPIVSGSAGLAAVAIANQIQQSISRRPSIAAASYRGLQRKAG